jgi:S-DNA-T family DNA segregation ATPase FtsK/SpoIIIE
METRPACRCEAVKLPRNETIGLALLGLGLIALLGLLGGQGPAPLRVLFGWGAEVIILALALGGVAALLAGRMGWQVRWMAVAAGEILFTVLLTAAHLTQRDPLAAAQAGEGGGLLGWATSQLLTAILPLTLTWGVTVVAAGAACWLLWRSLPPTWTGTVITVLRQARRLVLGLLPSGAETQPSGAGQLLPKRAPEQASSPHSRSPTPADATPDRTQAAEARPAAQRQSPKAAKSDQRPQHIKTRPDTLPSLNLLRSDTGSPNSQADVRQRAQLLKQTLAEFGVPVEVISIKEGPTVTQFGLEPGEVIKDLRNGEVVRRRVSVHSIQRLSNDLALALSAASIRIEAPVPGRPYVGIEIPNSTKTMVSLRSILESSEFAKVRSPLAVALGRDVAGDPVVADLGRLPHLLIAGATGSGKSVCINALVSTLLMNNGPERVRFVMIDPKMVELPTYNGIPHLYGSVITDASQVTGALAWLTLQMDDRYRQFADRGARNIDEYNRKLGRSKSAEPMPYIILVIDELADLMMTAAYEIERQICRLAQMSRATGIHLALATQRPSVDVITGLIKANFPSRIAFAVTSQIDSRVILDSPGAEKLLGRGDMLFMMPESAKLSRIQGAFVSDQEIDSIVAFWKNYSSAEDPAGFAAAPWAGMLMPAEEKDELLERALVLLQTKQHISASMLQRLLRIGYPRAARLMEQLEEMGVVGPGEGGGRSREVLARHAETVDMDEE